jgi:hypothetical protein
VQFRAYPGNDAQPFLAERPYLIDLGGMAVSHPLEQIHFVLHLAKIVDWHLTGRNHLRVPGKQPSAQDNSLIGFVQGHAGSMLPVHTEHVCPGGSLHDMHPHSEHGEFGRLPVDIVSNPLEKCSARRFGLNAQTVLQNGGTNLDLCEETVGHLVPPVCIDEHKTVHLSW